MAKNYKYSPDDLVAGQICIIKGTVAFSKISKKMTQEEIKNVNKNNIQRGMRPRQTNSQGIYTPYTTLTINDPSIRIAMKPNKEPEFIDKYIAERIYTTNATSNDPNKEKHKALTFENSGNNLPKVGIDKGNGLVKSIKLEKELAQGLKVEVFVKAYKSKTSRGIALEAVLVKEPIRYYESNDITNQLKKFGLSWQDDETNNEDDMNETMHDENENEDGYFRELLENPYDSSSGIAYDPNTDRNY